MSIEERIRELGVNTEIHPKDSMHHKSESQYFAVGASGLEAVEWGLGLVNKPDADVRRVLHYASGYGRVARWLMARFDASLVAVDADPKAIEALKETRGADAVPADLSLKTELGEPWVGNGAISAHSASVRSLG